jgi:hypothetical protein
MRFYGWLLVAAGCVIGWEGINKWSGLANLQGNPFLPLAENLAMLTIGLAFTAFVAGLGLLAAGKHKHTDEGYPEGYRSSKKKPKNQTPPSDPAQ